MCPKFRTPFGHFLGICPSYSWSMYTFLRQSALLDTLYTSFGYILGLDAFLIHFCHFLDTLWTHFAKICPKCVHPHILHQHRILWQYFCRENLWWRRIASEILPSMSWVLRTSPLLHSEIPYSSYSFLLLSLICIFIHLSKTTLECYVVDRCKFSWRSPWLQQLTNPYKQKWAKKLWLGC